MEVNHLQGVSTVVTTQEDVAHHALGFDDFLIEEDGIGSAPNEMTSLEFLPELGLSAGKTVIRTPFVSVLSPDVLREDPPAFFF